VAALQCEICGGKLIGKPGGVFECDSCGMEYSLEWAKAKVQEIKGTVKIEGPVEVTGTVKVEGGANTDSLLQRGGIALEDGNWDDAKALFQEALKIQPERAEGYLGLAMVKYGRSNWETFMPYYIHYVCGELNDSYIQHAYQFATAELKAQFSEIEKTFQKRIPLLKEKRETLLPASQLIFANDNRIIMTPLDGKVICGREYSEDNHGQRDTSEWEDIVEVAAGAYHTVGLKVDGTVVATDFIADVHHGYYYGQCDVTEWTDIISIAAGAFYTVGLKSDGTVIATGDNDIGQCNVNSWTDIIAIVAGTSHTVGLKADGTVVATGDNNFGQCNVHQWKDVVAIAAGGNHTVALKSNGTVVASGMGTFGQCNVGGWQDIVMVATSDRLTAGVKSDGTVIMESYNTLSLYEIYEICKKWEDIVFVATGRDVIFGLKSDGTVVLADGYQSCLSSYFMSGVTTQRLFNDIKTLKPKKTELAEYKMRIRNQKQAALKMEQAYLQGELANLKGLFSGGKRRELEARLAQTEKELDEL